MHPQQTIEQKKEHKENKVPDEKTDKQEEECA